MNARQLPAAVEARDDRALAVLDAQQVAVESAEDQVRETVQLIHILDEMTTLDECMLMNRLLMCRKNAAEDVFKILGGALDRAIKAQVRELIKVPQ